MDEVVKQTALCERWQHIIKKLLLLGAIIFGIPILLLLPGVLTLPPVAHAALLAVAFL